MRTFGALLALFVAFTASAAPTGVTGSGLAGPVDGVVSNAGGSNVLDSSFASTAERRAVDINSMANVVNKAASELKAANKNNIAARDVDLPLPVTSDSASDALKTTDADTEPVTRRDIKSLPAVIVDATGRIGEISKKIDGVISVGVKVDVKVLLHLLVEIKDILIKVVVDIKVLMAHPTDSLLTLNGKVLSVVEIAKLVAFLIHVVVGVIHVVVRAVGTAHAEVNVVLADISDHLSIVLSLSFRLVAKLLATLLPLIRDITKVIRDLKVLVSLAVVLRL